MHGVAKRLLGGSQRGWHCRVVAPDVDGWHGDVFGETARPIHADNFDIAANMRCAGATLVAVTANNVRFRRDKIADLDAHHVRANLHHIARQFVTKQHRRRVKTALRPRVPFVNMQIGATDRRCSHPNQHFVARRHWHSNPR